MRTYSILVSLLLISSMAVAQNGTYTASNEGWLVSLDEAYAQSQKLESRLWPTLPEVIGVDGVSD